MWLELPGFRHRILVLEASCRCVGGEELSGWEVIQGGQNLGLRVRISGVK